MKDFLCKVYDKLYCFLGYAVMGLILGMSRAAKAVLGFSSI